MASLKFIREQIQKEEAVFEYRQKLRTQNCSNHVQNLRSECAKCRSLFWLQCLEMKKEEPKQEPRIGTINTIKSEPSVRRLN